MSEIAAARHGAVTRRQAADCGLTKTVIARLIRDEVLADPVPGVLVARAAPCTWHQQLYVATLASRGAGVAGFRSAAALHGMDGYEPGPIELLVPSSRHIALPRLVMHRGPVPRADVLPVHGIACTSIARTLCDVASVDEPDRVRLAFEWVWRNRVSLTWVRRTAERLASPRRRGPAMILALVKDAERRRGPTDSALELAVESVIDSLPGVVRQFAVKRDDGSAIGRVDFAVPALRIAIEAHSREYHWGPDASEHDAAREATCRLRDGSSGSSPTTSGGTPRSCAGRCGASSPHGVACSGASQHEAAPEVLPEIATSPRREHRGRDVTPSCSS